MVSPRRRFVRFIGWCIAAFASVAAVLLLVFATYLIFFDYPETLRQGLERELSAVAGSPVKIGLIYLHPARYAFELRNISVEGPDENPLLTVDRVWGQLRLSEILRFRLHWTELLVQGLTLRLSEGSAERLSLARATGAGAASVRARVDHRGSGSTRRCVHPDRERDRPVAARSLELGHLRRARGPVQPRRKAVLRRRQPRHQRSSRDAG